MILASDKLVTVATLLGDDARNHDGGLRTYLPIFVVPES
jgi:hypothetical protein